MKRFEGTYYKDPFCWNNYAATCAYDIETTVKNRGEIAVGSSKASPHHPDNYIVAVGLLNQECVSTSIAHNDAVDGAVFVNHGKLDSANFLGKCFCEDDDWRITLIGHNIKFDLLYTMKLIEQCSSAERMCCVIGNMKVWDTMVVEYLLSGQQEQMPSLDKLCTHYGQPLKDAKIKEYWANGVETEDIPADELLAYLRRDVANTYNVYIRQYDKARAMGMIPLIHDQMEQLLATTVMEYNGMHVNVPVFADDMKELLEEVNGVEEALLKINPDLNPNSPKQLHTWLYGGTVVDEEVRDVLDKDGNVCYFKSGLKKGLKKTTKVKVHKDILPNLSKDVISNLSKKDTSEEVLKEILELSRTHPMYTWVVAYVDLLLRYRTLSKEYGTYYVGVGNLIWPHDDCVHGNLNMAVTATGRLSSSAPNLQNMPGYSED